MARKNTFTEKVFKPIVMHQPFIISQAPGSLNIYVVMVLKLLIVGGMKL